MDTSELKHDDDLAGDLLVGGDAVHDFLVHLGMPKTVDPYYLKRTGHWPIGKTAGGAGGIIASKKKLIRHVDKITRGKTAVA